VNERSIELCSEQLNTICQSLISQYILPKLNLLGVLATLYKRNSAHAQEVLSELRAVFEKKVFHTVLYDEEVVAQAPVAGKSVLAYRPESQAAAAFRQLAEEINHV